MISKAFFSKGFVPFLKRFGSESFIILDIGTFSVKAMVVEIHGDSAQMSGYSKKNHAGWDMNSNQGFDPSKIAETCDFTLKDLKKKSGRKFRSSDKVVLGIGGGFMYGKTIPQSYIRENPGKEIDNVEFINILQKIQQRNFEAIRRDFKKETGRSELEVRIVNSAIQEVKIDGYQVVNAIGFSGKEVVVSLFNSYIAEEHLNDFLKIVKSLKLELASIACEPFAVFSSVSKGEKNASEFILIDIGGSVTEVALSRKGRLEDIRSIPIGGTSFTRSISEGLKVGFWEAENIKCGFYQGNMSRSAAKKINDLLARDMEVFLRGLSMVLSDFSHLSLLPSRIYVYGGGCMLPLLFKELKRKEWRDSLSFFSKPIVGTLSPIVGLIDNPSKIESKELSDVSWTIPVAVANMFIKEFRHEDETAKVLKRILRLIQD
ncbi:MAG: hypothetical protein A3B96_03485 [Candidatus Spechtbacteria bacterium RIFCSPHIGHO2_02_FULL_43_15b]|uniref:SHS2 domain-containing protein n=1 Tax=Candidatus Spechtbacteria bacterium RIFCSPHIGHO2_01_FULL_43_30 TaxID=1802158 RepID=A0A1G2H7G6_9BACT|nr:MAG: hypothetical protein A2827_02360 [Candidatus Spechtbacteria bacterium RIFCSPHIGHO2_01_FULL_43_30]OGZ59411.1 MAG: hypothetical protein A3B96_03485 [Candidatus Spechtbacteria bacterium RIFCSPHIGHO2_02_FULL_43_15b]